MPGLSSRNQWTSTVLATRLSSFSIVVPAAPAQGPSTPWFGTNGPRSELLVAPLPVAYVRCVRAGVADVHDIHIWTITSGVPVFSAHVVVEDGVLNAHGADQMLDQLTTCLGSHFDTEHCTFQLEPASHSEHESRQHA